MGGTKLGCVSRLFGSCLDPKRAREKAAADTAEGDAPWRPQGSSQAGSMRSARSAAAPQSGGKRRGRIRKKVKINAPQSVLSSDILSLASDLASSVCSRQSSRAGSVYHDAAEYDFRDASRRSPGGEASATIESNSSLEEFEDAHELDGWYFFAAEDDPDIPSEVYEGIHRYPARPTDRVDPRPLRSPVSVSDMRTLLHDYQHTGGEGEGEDGQDDDRGSRGSLEAADRAGAAMEHQAQSLMRSDSGGRRSPSAADRMTESMERSTERLLRDLRMPDVRVRERGFPGELDESELETVKRFRAELSARDPVYGEIVRSFSDVEGEAYALCRWLRARKFDVDKVFELLDQARPNFEVARSSDFYPDFEAALGFPRSVFLSQYPAIFSGNARNGCPVMYLRTGLICPDGIKCLVSFDVADRFFWNDVYYGLRSHLARGREYNPDFARCENIGVYDLKGLSRSQVTSDTFEMIKVANGVMASFPETLHCLLIINAPSWFGFIWAAIRKFIDPRTASKIEVFTSQKSSIARMKELIDETQLPADYGGSGPSLDQAAAGSGSSSSSRPCSKLVVANHLMTPSRKHKERTHDVDLDGRGGVTFTIHTRCRSGATAALFRGETLVSQVEVVPGDDGGDDKVERPYSRTLGAVTGPGSYRVKIKGTGDGGTFLLIGTTTTA